MNTMDKQTPKLSKKNPYWIPTERYYELKHFCLQYSHWKKMLGYMNLYPTSLVISSTAPEITRPVEKISAIRDTYLRRIKAIDETIACVDPDIGPYIFKGVTEGKSYEVINASDCIPCCKDKYYELYRKFFWLLDKVRE